VFRVKVTEAHCIAEWLGGKLPDRNQWFFAAGKDTDKRPGPFIGSSNSNEDLAVGLDDGPRPVTWGKNHVSIHGCRQMAGNGFEWTRDLVGEPRDFPLPKLLGDRKVYYVGQSYRIPEPLLFKEMDKLRSKSCKDISPEIGFRVVLERSAQELVAMGVK
jgi:formylglycine-generating enzyme required for sulfatase activity